LAVACAATASGQPAPEIFDPSKCVPPLGKKYKSNPQQIQRYHQRWRMQQQNVEIMLRLPRHKLFSGCKEPPPPSPDPGNPPPPQVHMFNSILEAEVSLDGGGTWSSISVSNETTVLVSHNRREGDQDIYDTEMVQLDIAGGSLPPGVLIRESPSLHSTGQMTVRPAPGGYMISSFFDVFTELSMDGGATWTPSTDESGAPFAGHVILAADEPTNPIPTLSEWGLIILTLLLLTVGTLALRRTRARLPGAAPA